MKSYHITHKGFSQKGDMLDMKRGLPLRIAQPTSVLRVIVQVQCPIVQNATKVTLVGDQAL